ncbi:MAG: hypothetical protein AAF623_08800, partial [Planctomycetota bacterium]
DRGGSANLLNLIEMVRILWRQRQSVFIWRIYVSKFVQFNAGIPRIRRGNDFGSASGWIRAGDAAAARDP